MNPLPETIAVFHPDKYTINYSLTECEGWHEYKYANIRDDGSLYIEMPNGTTVIYGNIPFTMVFHPTEEK